MFHMQRQRKLPEEHARWVQPGAGGSLGGREEGSGFGEGARGVTASRQGPGQSREGPGSGQPPQSAACAVAPCFPLFLKRGERPDHQLSRLDGKAAPRHLHGCTAGARLEEEDHPHFFLNDAQGH